MHTVEKRKRCSPGFLRFITGLTAIFLVLPVFCSPAGAGRDGGAGTEILWDTWGVPHIFAKDNEDLFYAFGWSQMQSHGDLILKLYGEARGRASEYWGESHLQSDIFIRTMGVPQRAREWFNAYSPDFRKYLAAFAGGMNDYAAKHGDKLDKQCLVVLPVTPEDVLAHTQRVIHLFFLGYQASASAGHWEKAGSNGWAIAPSHSENGHAMLLTNPHLPWFGFYLFYEAQLIAPGLDAYGITFVGMPMLIMAFNKHLGWTHTVNVHDGADLYELKPEQDGYRLDGLKKNFTTESQTIKVKAGDGTIREQELTIRHSVYGPVVAKKEGKALALKIAGLDRPLIWKQRFDMVRATNLREFETALKQLQEPMLNVIYADRDGHIMLLHNAVLPKRGKGDWNFWQGIIPGDRSDTLWTQYHPYGDLPKVVDPPNGWVQDANQPPWTSTYPLVLKSEDYVNYLSIPTGEYGKYSNDAFRTLRSVRLLQDDKKISFAELLQYKHSTRMELADRVLDDLFPAVQQYGSALAKEAAKVLDTWDRTADSGSRGGVLFEAWVKAMQGEIFAKEWQADAPFTTPDRLKDPQAAAAALEKAALDIKEKYGALDIPWGDVYRIKYAGKNFPANGGPGRLGIFRTMYFYPDDDGTLNLISGDTYIAAVEFTNPVKAMAVLGYGNSSQPLSPHRFDQIQLVAEKKLRPAWLTKAEIEKHLEKRETFPMDPRRHN